MRRLLSLLAVLFVCPVASAQWRPVSGPLGVDQDRVPVAIDPLNADSVFLGGRLLWHSTDGGKTWAPVDGVPARSDIGRRETAFRRDPDGTLRPVAILEPNASIRAIAFSRDLDGPVLVMGTRPLISDDRGKTWQRNMIPFLPGGSLQAGPAGSNVFYGIEGMTVRRSDDNGVTWKTVFEPEERVWLACFVADRFDAGTIAFRVSRNVDDRRLLISRDGGKTFRELTLPQGDRYLVSLSTDPDDPELLYACSQQLDLGGARKTLPLHV